MSENETISDQAFKALFADAKTSDPIPSADLMARVMADAASARAQMAEVQSQVSTPKSILQMLFEVFGGWMGASTLAACAGLGMLIGFAEPDAILNFIPGSVAEAGEESLGLYLDTDF